MKAAATNAVSNLAPEATNVLRDIRPPVEIPNGWSWLWWGAGILVALGLVIWAVRVWLRRHRKTPVLPIVPPHVRAKQQLEEALDWIGDPREFCILVSNTLRWYLEERFDFHAPERTTEEFLQELHESRSLTPLQKGTLSDFLQRCDLVKFAKYAPGEPELRELHSSALRLVDETAPGDPATPPTTSAIPSTEASNSGPVPS